MVRNNASVRLSKAYGLLPCTSGVPAVQDELPLLGGLMGRQHNGTGL